MSKKEKDAFRTKVRFPIGVKLVLIISVLVVTSLGVITALVTWFGSQDVQISAEENNRTVNVQAATASEKELLTIRANTFLLLDILNSFETSSAETKQTANFYFERNTSVAALVLTDPKRGDRTDRKLLNPAFFLANEIDPSVVDTFMEQNKTAVEQTERGLLQVLNGSPLFNQPVLTLLYPYKEKGLNQALVVFFSAEKLANSFGSGVLQTTFLVNSDGDILIHPDFELLKHGVNASEFEIFKQMRKAGDKSRQILFEESEKKYFGSYSRITGDLAVLTVAEAEKLLEPVIETTKRNIYLTLAVLSLSILFVWFFSKSVSTPVKLLAAAAHQIEQGEYDIDLKPKGNDEIGLLTASFVQMGKGLTERDRLKDSFGRFINKEIAELAMRGELALGGETKETTIFFSDIRSFTAISEKLTPAEVVEFLNEYMTLMVECVNLTHGVVDKFIGDAIMAVWGAPTSTGSPQKDALNCIRAALRMRAALITFNANRGGDKKPIIRIGCGINSGPVVAGQIGSQKRMEYTVIGDAVNLASRTEALNKPLGTDILITENTYRLVQGAVLVEEMPPVTVKGKEKPVRMFAVVNMPKEDTIPGAGSMGPKTLSEVRTLLGIPTPDFEKVDVNEDEKKYKIQS
ncbi:adenylate/guanylate cyclase domain-containing protein [Treponema phagedenis]|uniref:HAMP domain-containing protein n=1 Tax=Treponema phagedenis TaxID=162 RepID=A0AAE6ITX7_TREPH|nr:adenylate/guanylate cyclase domain-containing protein [Treponema phagedenis]QEJ98242.1 HAMP domain-containing protein [Treponema phagedenis]QEK03752.1 HAMP domain-containing protein [Treponema phagedenis]QEK09367.1 HAMP domain-containing protein [Treponema phagedenis]QSH94529.1 adenylate/guanylate cyclase domain-containing protein [Treponema phagedenis]